MEASLNRRIQAAAVAAVTAEQEAVSSDLLLEATSPSTVQFARMEPWASIQVAAVPAEVFMSLPIVLQVVAPSRRPVEKA